MPAYLLLINEAANLFHRMNKQPAMDQHFTMKINKILRTGYEINKPRAE